MKKRIASNLTDLSRLSLNQITTNGWNLREAVEGCLRHNIPSIGLWRNKVAEIGLAESKRLTQALHVSSLCRGGFFPAASEKDRRANIQDNLMAIDEAAELAADVLVLVCGPIVDNDLVGSRKMVFDGIHEIVPYAKERGVKLGVEPLHPMFAADRSVIVTLKQANDIAELFSSDHVGVIVDVFHVWWDPEIYTEIDRARDRILGFHVSDWQVPLPDVLLSRSMMGDGVIDLRSLRAAVENAGYSGPIEVEIFNQSVWDADPEEVLLQISSRYLDTV